MDRIGHYLADVCREIREEHGARQSVIAGAVNGSEYKVRRFERQDGKWSADTDEMVEAYAALAGLRGVDLWQMAVDRWKASLAAGKQVKSVRVSPKRDTAGRADTSDTRSGTFPPEHLEAKAKAALGRQRKQA